MSESEKEEIEQSELKVKFNIISKTLSSPFNQHFEGYKTGLVRGEPGQYVMTTLYGNNAEKLFRLQPRSDDVWLLTFPKCGTTWVSEMVWLLMNNFHSEKAAAAQLFLRVPFLEALFLGPGTDFSAERNQMLENIIAMPSPRILKSHSPFYLLHPNLLDTSKVIYVARNPKDVMVSYYYHHKWIKLHDYKGTLEEFAHYFMEDEVLFSPFFPHLLDAWSKRHHPNLHFMFFEDMKKDLRGEIVKVAAFLNQSPSDERLDKITEHLRFDNFEKNESVNNEIGKEQGWMDPDGKFIRKGKTGDWKNHFNPELTKKIDEWIANNLDSSDLKFITELEHQD